MLRAAQARISLGSMLFLDPAGTAEMASQNGLFLSRSHVFIMMSFLDGAAVVYMMISIIREGELMLQYVNWVGYYVAPRVISTRCVVSTCVVNTCLVLLLVPASFTAAPAARVRACAMPAAALRGKQLAMHSTRGYAVCVRRCR